MFLQPAPETAEAAALAESDIRSDGYVMNLTRLWAWRPDVLQAFGALRRGLLEASTLSAREQAAIVCAAVSSARDSYCSLAWGSRLAALSDPAVAAKVIQGASPEAFDPRERALVEWARRAVKDPNATRPCDVGALRAAGISDREIFEATVLAALRIAFSMVNAALGAHPDRELSQAAPAALRDAVTFGRPQSGAAAAHPLHCRK